MSVALDPTPEVAPTTTSRSAWLSAAALASLGAGAIHAAAIGVHAESRPTALTFTAIAAIQIGWGVLALVKSAKPVAVVGVLVNLGALVGWAWAKTAGISFIDGLESAESVQLADGVAAGLAAASLLLAAVSLVVRESASASSSRLILPAAAVVVAALSIYGMANASTHSHEGGHLETAAHDDGGDHAHGSAEGGSAEGESADAGAEHADDHGDDHDAAAVAPVPFDPTKPIDLGGVEGVTPEQQAEAENLLAVTLVGLPQWADYRTAEAAGFYSIGDGRTGTEHFINQEFMNDDVMLDPDRPESLVYDTSDGDRRLVAAMYMTQPGVPLDEVPAIGGKLIQWHIHNNLCYQPNGRLGGLTDGEGNCAPGLIKPPETPMVHVWLESHPCGPFAALEGIGAGAIKEGEERLCDEAHGAH
jgi:hypothetical protein